MKSESLLEAPPESATRETRRSWLDRAGLGALLAACAGQAWALLRALRPNVLYEEPRRFKAGAPDRFPDGVTFLEDRRVFVFRERSSFYAISAVCTHLGCTVKLVNPSRPGAVREFHCPCHGSKYHADGARYAGPAPGPLSWYRLEIAPDDGQLIVDLSQTVGRDFRLTV